MVSGSTDSFVAHLAVARFASRERAREVLSAAEIATDIHYPIPDHRQPGLPPPARVTLLPETERAIGEILTVPCFAEMTDSEVDRVCDALARRLSHERRRAVPLLGRRAGLRESGLAPAGRRATDRAGSGT